MASSTATTVEEYLAEMPEDRRAAIEAVRATVLRHLPDGLDEVMRWGMITYEVPLERTGPTYNGQPLSYAAIANQQRHMAVYLSGIYGDPARAEQFRQDYLATGKRLDMGRSCVRFTRLDQLPLELIGAAIGELTVEEFVAQHHH
jgi:hypothetical protein